MTVNSPRERPARATPLGVAVGPALLGVLALNMVGCSGGIRWGGPTYDRVHAEARAANKLTFVYFRNWYTVECTTFEEDVLETPPVLEAVADMYCVPLEFSLDWPLAKQLGLDECPSFAIVDPDGSVLAGASGKITQEALLDAIQEAKQEFAPSTQPAGSP